MPLNETHKKKLKKNLMILALIFAWCALIWAVTMVRIAHAAEMDGKYDLPQAFKIQRANHAVAIEKSYEAMNAARKQAVKRQIGADDYQEEREQHLKDLYDEDKRW